MKVKTTLLTLLIVCCITLMSSAAERICASGGCGATSCEFAGEVTVMGSGVMVDVAVACAPGYFACCHVKAYCFVPGPAECPIPPQ